MQADGQGKAKETLALEIQRQERDIQAITKKIKVYTVQLSLLEEACI